MCLKCGSDKVKEDVIDYAADNITAEIMCSCGNCGEYLNYFAYGSWEDPYVPTFD